MENKDKIEHYLLKEKGIDSPVVREMLIKKVTKYDDVAQEFAQWLEIREHGNGVDVNGYTAKKIYELAPRLDGIGVYNFLVDLRDQPEEAQKIIDEGFVVK